MATERVEYEYITNLSEVTADGAKAEGAMKDLETATDRSGISALAASEKYQAMGDALGRVASTTAQVRGGLEDLNISTEGVSKGLQKMTGVADLAEAPMLHITDIMRVQATAGTGAAMAMGALATATMSVGAVVAAVTAESERERKLFAALSAVTWGLTAAQIAYGAAVSGTFSIGTLAAPHVALVMGAIGAAVAGIATYAVASYQTAYGEEKVVPTTQLAVVHQGERISRHFEGEAKYVVHVHGQPDYSTMRMLERMLDRAAERAGW